MHFIKFFILLQGLNFAGPVADVKAEAQTFSLTIHFKNITTKTGLVSIGLYKNEDSFKSKKPFKILKISKRNMVNGKLIFKTNLPKGVYGIATLDDTNSNGEMDYNFFGYPLEGFGFSNYFHSGLSSPSFKSFQFSFTQPKTVEVKMKYM